MVWFCNYDIGQHMKSTGLEVIKLEYSLKLKIKRNDWLLADTCPQTANHCAFFEFENELKFYNLESWLASPLCYNLKLMCWLICTKMVSEYDQEIPQSQTADNPVAPRGRAAQTSRDTRKTN